MVVDAQIRDKTALTEEDLNRLQELTAEWHLLSDLSFSDLVLWIPERSDYLSSTTAFLAVAHIRPTTAATVFVLDPIGSRIPWGENLRLEHALTHAEIRRDGEVDFIGDLLVKEESVPVLYRNRVIAVISRHRNAELMRAPSQLELNYREIANQINQMISEGNFPIPNSLYRTESAPRVGDGLVRIDCDGVITFASPNARSALNRLGYGKEVQGRLLGEIFEELTKGAGSSDVMDESWPGILRGQTLRRVDFENINGVVDLLVVPLTLATEHVGAVVLLHNVTDLRRKDKALVTKDVTIKEIHHRVKNNLQTVSALLRLQSRRVADLQARAALEEAVRRVASIALVHETLSLGSTEMVQFDEIFEKITSSATELIDREIRLVQEGVFGSLDSQVATPLALVITELIHNAIEHGLHEKGDRIVVNVLRDHKECIVRVSDNGVGLPPDFSFATSSNLGLQIVKTLVENELKGKLAINPQSVGVEVAVQFPLGDRNLPY